MKINFKKYLNKDQLAQELNSLQNKSKEVIQTAQNELKNRIDNFDYEETKTALETTANNITTKSKEKIDDIYSSYSKEITEDNLTIKLTDTCNNLRDVILNEHNGTSDKLVKASVSKLGAMGTTASIFTIAAIAGTASTGTAIGTLSGAAFTSSALAWIGGSVATGTVILGAAAITGGVGAALGAGWVLKRYVHGEVRKEEDLNELEKNIEKSCLYLSTALKMNKDKKLNPIIATSIHKDVIKPLLETLGNYIIQVNSKTISIKNLSKTIDKLKQLDEFLESYTKKSFAVEIGIVSSVILQLYSETIVEIWDENELLVLDALRRSDNSLENASIEKLTAYVKGYEPNQINGIVNNIKGIYHELLFVKNENSDDDIYTAEMFEATNHPGADVIITNLLTGETKEFQLKATSSLGYIKEHKEKYEDINVIATSEVADKDISIESSGFSNQEITEDVRDSISKLNSLDDTSIGESMSVAAFVSLLKNIKYLLKGESDKSKEKEILENIAISAGTAGIFTLFLEI